MPSKLGAQCGEGSWILAEQSCAFRPCEAGKALLVQSRRRSLPRTSRERVKRQQRAPSQETLRNGQAPRGRDQPVPELESQILLLPDDLEAVNEQRFFGEEWRRARGDLDELLPLPILHSAPL